MSDETARTADHDTMLEQLRGIAQDSVYLLRQELRLARHETQENVSVAVRSTGLIVGGGLLTTFGSVYLVQGVVRALATLIPHWLASLLSGGALTAAGIAMVRHGANQIKQTDIVPRKTLGSLKEDKAWILNQINSRLK
jgi:hypothetical protein